MIHISNNSTRWMTAAAIAVFLTTNFSKAQSAEVNIYSSREPVLLRPVIEAFTAETGIKVNLVFAQSGLEERILAEGANSPADLLLTVDVSQLAKARDMGITQPIHSPELAAKVPAAFRDPNSAWFASSLRARVIFVSKERVKDAALSYEDLADPKWKGKLCMRDGQNAYNTSLIAHFVARSGATKAEEWLNGMKANLARKPSGGDRDVAKDIASGLCDIGVANTYYYGLMLNRETDRKAWAEAVRGVLPTFKGGGTHVNISGFAMAKHAPNKREATQLAVWLVGDKAQALYAKQNYENPIRAELPLDATVESFGPLKADSTPLIEIAANRRLASELVDKTGFNNGPSR